MNEVAIILSLFFALLFIRQLVDGLHRQKLDRHKLGRDRLDAVITAARDAGMVFRSGDYAEVGKTSEFKLGVEFDSGLACSIKATQTLDQVEIWINATGHKHDTFIDSSWTVDEAMGMAKMISDFQQAWEGRKARKMAEVG
jgi:hypothetical protein